MVDQFSEAAIFPEPSGIFHPNGQHYDVFPSIDFNQSVTSQLHVSEAPEVTSASNIQTEEFHFCEDDFLEINDLIGTEPTPSNIEKPVENLQFEDGLSELDLFQDAEMFLRDLGPITQETVSHAYMNSLESNIESQNYQLLPNPEDANLTVGDFWMHGERNTLNPAEGFVGSFSLPTSGILTSTSCSVAQLPNNDFTVFDLDGDASFKSHLC